MLVLDNLSFSYIDSHPILKGLSIELKKGKHIALIGESGCGKSTLLKLIFGLLDANDGKIFWGSEQVLGPAFNLVPGMEMMRYLAQDFDLMPHTTVAENIGKYLSNFYLEEKKARIDELLEVVDLTAFADTKVKFLSGGQQQRVALARVIAREPELLLLDEPFSHIDYSKRSSLRRDLFAYLKKKGITCIVATHDSLDTLSFADETIVLHNGQIVDYGETKEVYEFPVSKYVASLFGEVNELYLSDFKDDFIKDETFYIYPHQLMRSNIKGVLEVEVVDSYFKGDGYTIKCSFKDERVIYFDHPFELEEGLKLKLALKTYI